MNLLKKTTLENGLRIITIPQEESRAITVLVLVGVGSKYESKEENGISHFLEHMFFKGTKKRPNQLAVAETLDRAGGVYNAFTGKEYTGYWAKVGFQHFDLALDWIADIFLNSKIPSREIEKERGVIIEEINMYLDEPRAYVGDLWEKLLYPNQPAGQLIIGAQENIKKWQRPDFLRYLKNHYSAQNTIVCLAGRINPDEVIKKTRKYFAQAKSFKPSAKWPVSEKQERPGVLLHFKETDQTHLMLGARAYDLFHPQRYVQAVLVTILGGNMSSRLFIKVRGKEGLAYYIRSISGQYTDSGYVVTRAGVAHQNVEKTIGLILAEYRRLKEKKISLDELKKAQDYLKGILALSLESSDARASFYGMQELLENRILTPEEIFQKIDAVTVKDIEAVAQDIFQPNQLNLALIGPFKNKTKLQPLLEF